MASEVTILKSIIAQMVDAQIGSIAGDHPNVVQMNLRQIKVDFRLSDKAAQKVMEVTKQVYKENLMELI
ncbi:hypothetical protein EVB81_090 [Rhizobium phage RHph_I46]|uniref:Uncharacterized protein n=1 Tax=Rhizobium phage RHph_I1_9 TaxID=2509729 RepID=A0A7S5R9D0_9CAUD|nr:hypothetical protein PP936_gp089 [Rhizobium phage RHph_I1_9]QIG69659.1 hypothetical protein EVB81_090 [Rhizobium phage RHph_I46]QIG70940.1 hypothetical protein EVB92_090 [Rhizobium phage RHph_I9]QIG73526.1 hypothetical protein EVC04_089 [Rhizobium phage RHph_I1_9]QIG76279.1 hypothetical protein EVC25_090 [Rhizobium phage RHph_I34]